MDRIIWVRLVPTARWVISTPTGARVEPDVYCRWEISFGLDRENSAAAESGCRPW